MLVRFYRTVSPLPVLGYPSHRRSIFCGTNPARRRDSRFVSTLPCGAPTFLTARFRAVRPLSRLTIQNQSDTSSVSQQTTIVLQVSR
jgi:hypothetical protein